MPFRPVINTSISLSNSPYRFTEHPSAKGMPYGQTGRRATVYQVQDGNGQHHALKVFTQAFRSPRTERNIQGLHAFATLPGLQVCDRRVLTSAHYPDLLKQYPDLEYAVLMPWVEGQTWQETLLNGQPLSSEKCMRLAQRLATVLTDMEQHGLAHCDLSGPNVLLPILAHPEMSNGIALVDVEELYGPGLEKPDKLPGGSAGYGHKTAPQGLWSADADRFAAAVLLVEMLGWCDEQVRQICYGEQFFDPAELQGSSERYQTLLQVVRKRWGDAPANLLGRAWFSASLANCPTLAEWSQTLGSGQPAAAPAVIAPQTALPEVPDAAVTRTEDFLNSGEVGKAVAEMEAYYKLAPGLAAKPYARALLTRGAVRERAGDPDRALQDYLLAVQVAPAGGLKEEAQAMADRLHPGQAIPPAAQQPVPAAHPVARASPQPTYAALFAPPADVPVGQQANSPAPASQTPADEESFRKILLLWLAVNVIGWGLGASENAFFHMLEDMLRLPYEITISLTFGLPAFSVNILQWWVLRQRKISFRLALISSFLGFSFITLGIFLLVPHGYIYSYIYDRFIIENHIMPSMIGLVIGVAQIIAWGKRLPDRWIWLVGSSLAGFLTSWLSTAFMQQWGMTGFEQLVMIWIGFGLAGLVGGLITGFTSLKKMFKI